VVWAARKNKIEKLPRASIVTGFALAFVMAVVAGVLQLMAYTGLNFSWHDHAYGSIFYVTAGFQIIMLFTALVMSSFALFRLGLNVEGDEVEWVRATSRNAAITWYTNTVMWVLVFFTLYLSPGLL
jgi:heme/copper-type cytochrome/quinol oxidase subunit 3